MIPTVKTSRRWFVTKLFTGTVIASTCIYLPSSQKIGFFKQLFNSVSKWRKARNKEYIITQALATDEGRMALAQSMVEPIRRSLEYQSVGRKLFVDDFCESVT